MTRSRRVLVTAALTLASALLASATLAQEVGKHVRITAGTRRVVGVLESQDAESVTLRLGKGETSTFDRSDLASLEDVEKLALSLEKKLADAKTADECLAVRSQLAREGFGKAEQRAAFERAVVLDPGCAAAHEALGHVRATNERGEPVWSTPTTDAKTEAAVAVGQWFVHRRSEKTDAGAVTSASCEYSWVVAVEGETVRLRTQPLDAEGRAATGPAVDSPPPAPRDPAEKTSVHCAEGGEKVTVGGVVYECTKLLVGYGRDPEEHPERIEDVYTTKRIPYWGAVRIDTLDVRTRKRTSLELVAWGSSGGRAHEVGEKVR